MASQDLDAIPFPFEPYPAQRSLMAAILETLKRSSHHSSDFDSSARDANGQKELAQVALCESPTGTGKTLSLISSVLHWLFNVHPVLLRKRAQAADQTDPDAGPLWMRLHAQRQAEEQRQLREKSLQHTLDQLPEVTHLLTRQATLSQDHGIKSRRYAQRFPRTSMNTSPRGNRSSGEDEQEQEQELSFLQSKRRRQRRKHRAVIPEDDGDEDDDGSEGSGMGLQTPGMGVGWIEHAQRKIDELRRKQQFFGGEGRQGPVDPEKSGVDWDQFSVKWTSPDQSASTLGSILDPDTGREPDPMIELIDHREEDEDLDEQNPKIVFSTRTHSQIRQFLEELNKSEWAKRIRLVSLGSRKHLCVNPEVMKAVLRLSHVVGGMCPVCGLRLHSASAMNDKCLDLQRKKSKTRPGCPYLSRAPKTPHERREASNEDDPAPSGPNVVRISGRKRKTSAPSHTPSSRGPDLTQLRNYALKTPMDLEDLHTLGQFLHTCPYYASRRAVRAAHLVAAPYASLFHSGTRESLGLNLRGAVVVVDEAHNLIETLNDLHSPNLSLSVLDQAKEHLQLYLDRYEERLESRQLKLMFKQLTTLIDALLSSLRPTPPSGEQTEGEGSQQSSPPAGASSLVLGITDFLFQSGLDNVNLFHILRFIEETQLSKKLIGFRDQVIQLRQEAELRDEAKQGPDAAQDGEETSEYEFRQMSPLQPMVSFLQALSNADKDGRVVVEYAGKDSKLKFLMLRPSVHFRVILEQARAVLLLGGTMQPFGHFTTQLFRDLPPENIMEFACDHVVDPENVLAVSLGRGPSNRVLNFSFQDRESPALLDELGRILVNMSLIVPNGMVVFFTSYSYEEFVCSYFEKSGIMAKLQARKKVVRECRGVGHAETLELYSQYCMPQPEERGLTGALLTCVIGGKMSEGINFSDHLARCVIVVGLPYPNRNDPVLQQKMNFLDNQEFDSSRETAQRMTVSSSATSLSSLSLGEAYYHQLCMRAVNQSIGRTIRHKDDFGVILLLDERYSTRPLVRELLPNWIRNRLAEPERFGAAVGAIGQFFARKRRTGRLPAQ